ncbi:HAMP domain-containing histidine kinase (plasmid) [Niallia taxi]|uniref:HAMP domain-containing sensor histidine kinase n=1 Tax=Niallia taxi TaxID=2499688 RepID=UPI0029342F12|nr:HAMP domain-containing sensor histidine kinase [Niallia taxi]WOD65534.1 HAMP domain-containing histidine kinase [Niallia taxi]
MHFQYNQLLLQMLIVQIPIILYLVLANGRIDDKKEKVMWGLFCTITLALSITFSIILDGVRLDARVVPWYLAFIYGGTGAGLFVSISFFCVRSLFGGVGMIPSFVAMLISIMFIFIAQKKFHSLPVKKKIYLSVFYVTICSAMLPFIAVLFGNDIMTMTILLNYLLFILVNGILAWFSIYLIESHREKVLLRKEVQRNEKMQVVGELAASVAHEIRNPMTSIKGFLQLLHTADNISEPQKEYLKISLEEINRANEIISDYLSLGKNQTRKKHSVMDLELEAKKSISSLSSYALMSNVEISLEVDGRAVISGNSSQIQQMFINIIKNSIEAAAKNVSVKISQNKKQVDIFIVDDGEGLTTDQIDKLGLPFYSTKEKGTGLGLMVTLQIIGEMGGKWRVTSDKKNGTIFQITFHEI